MEWWSEIRRRVLVDGVSRRQILRETGIHWKTLDKILSHSMPPGYRRTVPRERPKIGPFLGRIRQIIEEDKGLPKKQHHTAKRIFERIRGEGYTGGQTQVKEAVREIRQRSQEVFMPLIHRPGEAQADFGYALVKEDGRLRKAVLFVMSLPHSDAVLVQMFDRICTEVFWEAHRRAFEFFGGVPRRITYDNEGVMVAQVIGARKRKLTNGFLQLQSHYLFGEHFCLVRRANEKGVVEGMVGYTRRNYLVPVPQVQDLEELNRQLEDRCREELRRRLRGKSGTKEQLLAEDKAAFLPLPAGPFDACRKESTIAGSLSLVRFDSSDYSVPVRWAHHPVVVKGYTDRVEVCFKDTLVASHERLWGKEGVCFEPLHYLALLERKPGALDHARPLEGWALPECFGVLRRRLEQEREGEGTREYIRVLRLLEKHSLPTLTRAVEKALRAGALTRDAIAQFLIPREEWRETTFRLDGREHLREVKVAATDVSEYGSLLGAGGGQ
jgi:transposase|tara:strand:- start:731 stop:2221 length:1491 start_codon:yes stop_codon:yes gene_type:complete